MKTQSGSQRLELGSRMPEENPVAVNYQWSGSDGTIFRGHTVANGRDQSHAERRFFRQHRHVMREAGGTLVHALLVVVLVLALTAIGLALEVELMRKVIRENNASVEEQNARRMQSLQTNALAREAWQAVPADEYFTNEGYLRRDGMFIGYFTNTAEIDLDAKGGAK
jgi:hypothetical protein